MSGVATAIVVVGAYTAQQNKKAAKEAADAQARAAGFASAEQQSQFQITQEQVRPFREAGVQALEQQQALLGLSGQEAQQEAFATFESSPGQQFLRERGEQTLLRNQAAIGGLGGGNVRYELQREGIGFAQQDLQNQLARLASIAGQGQAATQNVGQFGAQTTGNVGKLLTQAGQAQASGIPGAQQC